MKIFNRLICIFILAVTALSLNGCTTVHPPKKETVTRMRIDEKGIVMQSKEATYQFDNETTRKEMQRFKQFQRYYQPAIAGAAIHLQFKHTTSPFVNVKAIYSVLLNKEKIDKQKIAELYKKYKANVGNNHRVIVNFYTDGIRQSHNNQEILDDNYLLPKPFDITVKDDTEYISPAGEVLFMPFMPFFMMFGCLTGPCV